MGNTMAGDGSTEPIERQIAKLDELDDDDDDIEETYTERFLALSEMFPETLRNISYTAATGSVKGVKWFYGFSRNGLWILATTAAILILPFQVEQERATLQELQLQEQRKMIFGPNAAYASPRPGMPMPMSMPAQA